jgi:VRR-NUC domain
MTPEAKVKHAIKRRLDSFGAWYFMPVAGLLGRVGVPDFVGCLNGRFFAIEAKADNGRVTRIQQRCLDAIAAAGGTALVVQGVEAATALTKEVL